MLDMRLRLPELMARQQPPLTTAYALAKKSKGALPVTTAARLLDTENPPLRVDLRTLDTLCDVLNASPAELLEREKKRR